MLIQNWIHYQEPGSDWLTSLPTPANATGIPDNWDGSFTHQFYSRMGPMQIALGNDPKDRPHVRVRRSNHPGRWAEFIWLGGNAVTPVATQNDKRVRWTGWRQNTTLVYELGAHKLSKIVRLINPIHPAFFRFALKLPAGHSYTLTPQGRIRIRDDQGKQYMRTTEPFALDSSTMSLDTLNGKQLIPVTIEEDGTTAQGYQIFKLTPDANVLSSAVYPVEIDPSIQLNSAANIKDTYLHKKGTTTNFSNDTVFSYGSVTGSGNDFNALFQVDVSSIPVGSSVSQFDLTITHDELSGSGEPIAKAYIVSEANVLDIGSSNYPCWDFRQFTSSSPWAGAVGCVTSGTDYDTDSSPPSVVIDSARSFGDGFVLNLTTDWVEAWLGGRTNNGIILEHDDASNKWAGFSSVQGTYPPSFDIVYTDPIGPKITFMLNP